MVGKCSFNYVQLIGILIKEILNNRGGKFHYC